MLHYEIGESDTMERKRTVIPRQVTRGVKFLYHHDFIQTLTLFTHGALRAQTQLKRSHFLYDCAKSATQHVRQSPGS